MHHLIAMVVTEYAIDVAAVPSGQPADFGRAVLAESARNGDAGRVDDLDQVAAMEFTVRIQHSAREQRDPSTGQGPEIGRAHV